MKKAEKKKLKLNREALRILNEDDMGLVKGATGPVTCSCSYEKAFCA